MLHLLRVRGVDGLLDLALLQEAGDLGDVLARLLGGLLVRPVPLDHHADRPDRHDREYDHHPPGDAAHVLGHRSQVKLHIPLSPRLWVFPRSSCLRRA
jgi:hypothetical protein